jgi:hypothetical protein
VRLGVQINVSPSDSKPVLVEIKSFADINRLGHTVAREVRKWLRTVPMDTKPHKCYVSLLGSWQESSSAGEPKEKRARKARKKRAAAREVPGMQAGSAQSATG